MKKEEIISEIRRLCQIIDDHGYMCSVTLVEKIENISVIILHETKDKQVFFCNAYFHDKYGENALNIASKLTEFINHHKKQVA